MLLRVGASRRNRRASFSRAFAALTMAKNITMKKPIGKKNVAVKKPAKKHVAPRKYSLYLLRGGPKRKHAYVGMTNQPPERRLKQHNGLMRGGAVATKKHRGTWELHLVVSGLASKTAALVLEHAVQHPTTPPASLFAARHLKGVLPWCDQFAAVRVRCKDIKKKNFASSVEYRERVIKELLQMDLWRALTLKHHGAAAAPAALAAAPAPAAADEIVDLTFERRRKVGCVV